MRPEIRFQCPTAIGAALRCLRTERQVNMVLLSRLVHVSVSQLYALELGHGSIALSDVQRIERVLHLHGELLKAAVETWKSATSNEDQERA